MSQHPRPDEDYNSWTDIQDENIEPRETLESRSNHKKALSAEFAEKERNKNLRENFKYKILNGIQLEVEKEFHEEGNLIAYGISGNEVLPAFVMPSEDMVYANEEWVESRAEEMLSPEYFLDESEAVEPEILEGMKIGMPEGLENYAERVLDRVDHVGGYDLTEANKTYILPKLSGEQYNQL